MNEESKWKLRKRKKKLKNKTTKYRIRPVSQSIKSGRSSAVYPPVNICLLLRCECCLSCVSGCIWVSPGISWKLVCVCAASASIFTSVKEVGSFDVLLYLAFKGLLVSPCLFPGQLIHVFCVRVYGIYCICVQFVGRLRRVFMFSLRYIGLRYLHAPSTSILKSKSHASL